MSPLWAFLKEMKPRNLTESTEVNNSVTGNSPSAIQNGSIFFSRLNIFLFNKMLGVMINFLNDRVPNALDLLVNNLDLQPISELLYRFCALYDGENEILDWLDRGGLYEKLADQLKPSKGSESHMATCQFIKGIFSLPFPESYPREKVVGPIIKAAWLSRLLENMFRVEEGIIEDDSIESSLVNGLEIIVILIRSARDFNLEPFISCLMNNFETFYDLLTHPNDKNQFLNSISGRIEKFGRIRLKIVEIFLELLTCKNYCEKHVETFLKVELLPILLDSFFQYRQNNILHDLIVKIMGVIFDSSTNVYDRIIDQILKDYNLRNRIIESQRENDVQVQRPRGCRLPFMGHLTLIAESLISWENEKNLNSRIKNNNNNNFVISEVPEETWREYSMKSFRETRLKDGKVLGGIKPTFSLNEMISSSDEDSGEEYLNYNSIFRSGDEEQMARYFCQQLIGNLPNDFLYASEEDNDNDDDDEDLDLNFVFDTSKSKKVFSVNKSIEIPILMSQDDFDDEMFDDSFTSALFSDESDDDDDDESDENDSDEDYEMISFNVKSENK